MGEQYTEVIAYKNMTRLEELDLLIKEEKAKRPDPRLPLVTVSELHAICPVCAGKRQYFNRTCSKRCGMKLMWSARPKKKQDRADYWKNRWRKIVEARGEQPKRGRPAKNSLTKSSITRILD